MRRTAFVTFAILSLVLPGRVSADVCWCPPPPMCWYGPPIIFVPICMPVPMGMAMVPAPAPSSSGSPKVSITPARPLTTETTPNVKAPQSKPKDSIRPAGGFTEIPPVTKPEQKAVTPPLPMETIPPTFVPKPAVPSAPPPDPLLEMRPTPMPEVKPSTPPVAPPTIAPPSFTPPEVKPSTPPVTAPPVSPSSPLTLPEVPKWESKEKTPPPLPDLVIPPPAIPTPAPPPPEPGLTLPSNAPQLPIAPPETRSSDTGLPPLVLPPVKSPSVTAQASPLVGLPRVRTIPVAAATQAAAYGKRKVGFFNYTDRTLDLVIEGQKATLPKRSYLNAEVPATFAWKMGTEDSRTVSIPAGQAGVEFVIE